MQIVTKAFGMRNRLFVAAAFEIILSRESNLRWKNWPLFLLLVAIFARQEQYRPDSFVSVVSNRFEEAYKHYSTQSAQAQPRNGENTNSIKFTWILWV